MVTKKSQIALVSLFVASTCLAEATATKTSAGKSSEKAAETAAKPAEKTKPEAKAMTPADAEKASYGIGMRIGSSLKAQNIPVNLEGMIAGIKDMLNGSKAKYSDQEIEQAMTVMQAALEKEMAEKAEKNKKDGEEFLAKNKKESGVKVTERGVQYKVITEGKGDSPKDDSKVKVHYRGTLLDGTEFDSSYKRNTPAEFNVNGVIPGWTEALKLMKPGAKWELTIPSELAYGARGTPGIPPNSVLKFTVELLEVVKDKPADKARS